MTSTSNSHTHLDAGRGSEIFLEEGTAGTPGRDGTDPVHVNFDQGDVLRLSRRPRSGPKDEAYLRSMMEQASIDIAAGR